MRDNVLKEIELYFPKVYELISRIDDIGFGEWYIETDAEQLIYDYMNKTMRPYSIRDDDDEVSKRQFGIRLRKMIAYKGVTQLELSERTGITQAMLSRYMNGYSFPTFNKACLLANALDCSLDDFRYK